MVLFWKYCRVWGLINRFNHEELLRSMYKRSAKQDGKQRRALSAVLATCILPYPTTLLLDCMMEPSDTTTQRPS